MHSKKIPFVPCSVGPDYTVTKVVEKHCYLELFHDLFSLRFIYSSEQPKEDDKLGRKFNDHNYTGTFFKDKITGIEMVRGDFTWWIDINVQGLFSECRVHFLKKSEATQVFDQLLDWWLNLKGKKLAGYNYDEIQGLKNEGVEYVWCNHCPKDVEKFISVDDKFSVTGIDNAISKGYEIVFKKKENK